MAEANVKKQNKIFKFFKEVKAEMKKVVWPSFAKIRQNTITVIIYVLIIGLVICGLDWLFTWLMSLFY